MGCCDLKKIAIIATGFSRAILRQFEDLSKSRTKFCDPCEHRKGRRCTLCKCFINEKTRVEDQFCPVGKWSSVPKITK